jgi:hypothetical protein
MGPPAIGRHRRQSEHQERHPPQDIVVTGSDGYESVFTSGEIAPNFGGNQIMVAYLVDGQLLGTQGPTRIVVPSDKQGGRFVSMIVTIEVRDGG